MRSAGRGGQRCGQSHPAEKVFLTNLFNFCKNVSDPTAVPSTGFKVEIRLETNSEGAAIFDEDSVDVVELPAHTVDCGDGWLDIVGGDEAISARQSTTAEQ